jgi:hypothetical protein
MNVRTKLWLWRRRSSRGSHLALLFIGCTYGAWACGDPTRPVVLPSIGEHESPRFDGEAAPSITDKWTDVTFGSSLGSSLSVDTKTSGWYLSVSSSTDLAITIQTTTSHGTYACSTYTSSECKKTFSLSGITCREYYYFGNGQTVHKVTGTSTITAGSVDSDHCGADAPPDTTTTHEDQYVALEGGTGSCPEGHAYELYRWDYTLGMYVDSGEVCL